jgi:hypothetical protein
VRSRFLLLSAIDINRVSPTGINDPSKEENRIGSVIANQNRERVIGAENGGLRFGHRRGGNTELTCRPIS